PQDAAPTPAPPAPEPAPEGPEGVSVSEAETPDASARPADPAGAPPAEAPPASEGAVPAPPDAAMYLTVPALEIEGARVVSDSSKEAMDQGVIHVPGTGFPWLPSGEEGSNTYLAAHRIGYPGTGSDRIFYELPALALGDEVILTDSNGTTYTYRVAEASEVSPYDTWVANPVPGRDVVTLQTCIEDFGDRWGEGPDWAARYVVRADRVS
ncbi:MAG: class E sortase, partial [Actinomycetota bacterium]|nr:class E sortase [Actinomycetota bacterium]